MHNAFVKTANVQRFLSGVASVEERGAPEASFLLVSGDAGHGKSHTASWWALHNNAAQIRVKAAATPHWVLTDIVTELGEPAPARNCEKLFAQAVGILARDPRPLVIDEVENTIKDLKVLETIRDISDLTEIPVVLVGREYVPGRLKREKQIWSRISAWAAFQPCTRGDVEKCVAELCEIPVDGPVIDEIFAQCEGRIREAIKAIAVVERAGRRTGGKVTLDAIAGRRLTQDFQRTRKREG